MILDPMLSYKEIDASEVDVEAIEDIAIAEGDAYPVEALSERFLQTLFEAHRIVNIPDAGLRSLQRHFRSLTDTEGADAARESVGE